ncbi:MAG: hypothetical protein C0518_01725 [Opitutus sp.]|nr:hypothetical protein [Opitutus sp.]
MKNGFCLFGLLVGVLTAAAVSFAASAQENFSNDCASCHGEEGKGDTKQGKKLKVKDYTDPSSLAQMTDAQLAAAIGEGVKVNGKERMKPFPDYTSEEVNELVQLIRSFAKK